MSCEAFERWLDDGAPESLRSSAEAHALGCASCARSLRAALEIEELLVAPPVAAPAGFTASVMARVADAASARARAPRIVASPFAWWVRAAWEPATLLTAAIAALLLWRGHTLLAFGSLVIQRANLDWATAARVPVSLPAFLADPTVMLGAGLAATPLALWASWQLYRWSARKVSA